MGIGTLAKSLLTAVGEVVNLDQLVVDLGCWMGHFPSTYLGLPQGAKYKNKEVWNPVVERMRNGLMEWKSRYLI